MREHGFLFNSEMVNAIKAGIKTQTRRIMRPICNVCWNDYDPSKCPWSSGDLIYVRETYAVNEASDLAYRADGEEPIDGDGYYWTPKWIPSIHMPKRMARIWLEIVSVRPERLQSITEADAIAEGVEVNCCKAEFIDGKYVVPKDKAPLCGRWSQSCLDGSDPCLTEFANYLKDEDGEQCYSARESFQTLWDSIYGNTVRGRDKNP